MLSGARAARKPGAVEERYVRIDEGGMRLARERLEAAQQRMAGLPVAKRGVVLVLAGPEFRQIVMRHDLVLGHRLGPHCGERCCHLPGLLARTCAVTFRERQQDETPVPQRRESGRDRTERRKGREHGPRLSRPAELKQRQRVLQMPMAQRRLVRGQRRSRVQERERVGRTLLLQQHRDEVEPRAGILGRAGEGVAQQRLAGLGLAGDVHEGAQIGGGRSMARLTEQRLAHRSLGVLDVPLPVAGDTVTDPGSAQRGASRRAAAKARSALE